MSASWRGNMRGPQVKTPVLLLLLLLTTLTRTAFCQDEQEAEAEDNEEVTEATETEQLPSDVSSISTPLPTESSLNSDAGAIEEEEEEGSAAYPATSPDYIDHTTGTPQTEEELGPIIILIPVVLVVVIIAIIVVGICIKRRWNKKTENQDLRKEDPFINEAGAETVPMPMFEEDVPSVLELEMEELDQWMKKDETAQDSKQA